MKKKCFIITPIGEEKSEIRKKAEQVIETIRPVLKRKGYISKAAHEIAEPNIIIDDIVQHLLTDDLVVANLTGLNANVMYELSIRHLTGKPVICLIEKGTTKLPFDIQESRSFFYEHSIEGMKILANDIKNVLKVVDVGKLYKNMAFKILIDYIEKEKSKNSPFVYFFNNIHRKNKRFITIDNGTYSRLIFDKGELTDELAENIDVRINSLFSRYKIPTAQINDIQMGTITIFNGNDEELMDKLKIVLDADFGFLNIKYELNPYIGKLKRFINE